MVGPILIQDDAGEIKREAETNGRRRAVVRIETRETEGRGGRAAHAFEAKSVDAYVILRTTYSRKQSRVED